MDETELEKLAHLSGKAASKTLGALEPRGAQEMIMTERPPVH
jgi:hypothetical protein